MTLANTNSKVKIQGKVLPSFETVIGLRQGDSLSTLLFNLRMEKIIRHVRINPGEQFLIEQGNTLRMRMM